MLISANRLWLVSTLCCLTLAVPALAAHSRHRHRDRLHGGGMTYCTFYHDRLGRTASNLVPRGSVVLLSRGGTAIRVRITDRGVSHFDLTPGEFRRFAPLSRGVVGDIHYRVLSRR